MNDLDTRLRESLQSAGRAFGSGRSPAPSPDRFRKARRRRMFLRSAGVVAVTAALIVTAVLVIPTERSSDDSVPVGPAPIPEGPIEITARIDVAPMPLGVAAGQNVYVGHSEVEPIEIVDPTTNEVISRYEYGKLQGDQPAPQVVAAGPEALYVGRRGGLVEAWGSNMRLPFANTKTNVEHVGEISGLAYGDGFVWVAGAGSSPELGCCEQKVLQLSSKDLSLVQSHAIPDMTMKYLSYPSIDYGYGALWVTTNEGKGDGLMRIDPDTGAIETVPGIDSASDVAVGAGGVWVYENSSKAYRSRVMRIDPETLEVELETIVLGYFAWLEADDNGIWVLNASDETDRRLLRLDPVTGDSMGTSLRLGAGPFETTSGFDSIWITDEGKGELLRVDVAPVG